jgi:hypothetical protein
MRPFVQAPRHVIVRAQIVKVGRPDPLDHEVDGLFRRPGAGRLFAAAALGQAGEYMARNMRADLVAVGIA